MRMLASYGRDRRGNFAILASIAAIPLVMAAGMALDYSALSRTRAALQNAMDTAALAIAREGKDLSSVDAEKIAAGFLNENFSKDYTKLAIARDGSAVTVKALTMAPLAFGGLLGYDKWPINVASSADIAYASYEIALVLDTTGSMKGGKLTAMKDAANGLIDTMSAQVDDTDKLKFAVVPFANFVNVGPEHGPKFDKDGKVVPGSGAAWLDVAGASPIPQLELVAGLSRFELFEHLGHEWKGCVETRMALGGNAHDTDDTPATAADKASLFVPAFGIDEPDEWGYSNDYIESAVDPLEKVAPGQLKKLAKYGVTKLKKDDAEEDGSGGWIEPVADFSGGKGPNQACVTQPIMPLNANYAALKSKIDSLQANGTTNIMEGVTWGMRVLSPGEPFAQGVDKTKKPVEKIMIVLTDGANVFGNNGTDLGSAYASRGYLVDGRLGIDAGSAKDTNALMNARTLEACTHAKDDGYIVYTIRLEEPDVATGTMLKECATSAAHYFDVPSRSQLDEAFQAIKERVVRVRLAS